ncbi:MULTISPECIES: hypothetical protein [unclassified Mesorhizobium]|uniref:hypothetical protein n=1 Tax=unclassified Mesorhizobium TaxID=325217 RepID=UPI000FE83AA3|nr:hypothetical protein [Mesorhizobium sp.]RWP10637.1 MAG: hypothetical protein EOQ97_12575 [Mesorhizobium sp.]
MSPELRDRLDAERQARADELYAIASLLEKWSFTTDAGPVREAASQCRGAIRTVRGDDLPDRGREYWGYEITDLLIALHPQRHCRPRDAIMDSVSGSLTVTVQEYVPATPDEVGSGFPLLRKLDTDFFFDAQLVVDGSPQAIRSAWHLDTHLYVETVSDSVHPRFHFQMGGERLDHFDHLIRGVFVPEAPRMPAAPLDGVLAIDFVLAHYCGSDWSELREIDATYRDLRVAPIRRYWGPYFKAISDGIANMNEQPDGGTAKVLIPNIFAP